MTTPEEQAAEVLTLAEVDALVGDDVAYWLGNPFLDADLLAKKVCWWVTTALRAAERRGAEGALRAAAKDWHDIEQALEAIEDIILDAEERPFRFTPSERRRMAVCDVLSERADTYAEGDDRG